jgi:hypothetical protein
MPIVAQMPTFSDSSIASISKGESASVSTGQAP